MLQFRFISGNPDADWKNVTIADADELRDILNDILAGVPMLFTGKRYEIREA